MRRRELLKALLLGACGGGFLSRVAEAASRPDRTLLLLFLRGGFDSLHAVPPRDDPEYLRARPRLAVRDALRLDGRFGLHPALGPLLPLYREGSLAIVQGVGNPAASRSHFQAQDLVESGGTGEDGWLNRYAQRMPGRGPLRALCTRRGIPRTLRGEAPVAAVASLDEAAAMAAPGSPLARLKSDPRLRATAAHATSVAEALRALRPEGYASAIDYPACHLGEQLRLVAFLLKKRVELRAVHAELDGFDFHAGQAGMDRLLRTMADCLAAFWRDLGPLQDRVLVLTLTEFGRRVRENGSLGTDHGHASCAFALGAGVRGGAVLGRWPGLDQEDLSVTTDYRDALVEAAGFLGCPQPAALFPGHRVSTVGLMRR